ncbi:MAG: PA14 domain-containing protein, partial [Gemmataceae bacterium]
YDNANFTNRRAVQVDPSLKFFWKGESPVLGVSPTSFSVRWVGKLKALESGFYTLRAFNDNGVRVWVNGVLQIDNWTTRNAGFSSAKPIFLRAGQRANIRVDYFHASGPAQFRLEWRRPSQTFFSQIPYSQLWLPET